ncbi:MAG: hypothetical protein ACPLSJ_07250 [Thermosulfidibacteraceae bacterium]|jgi:hypothetical protein
MLDYCWFFLLAGITLAPFGSYGDCSDRYGISGISVITAGFILWFPTSIKFLPGWVVSARSCVMSRVPLLIHFRLLID